MKRQLLPIVTLMFLGLASADTYGVAYENSSKLMAAGNFFGDGKNEVAHIRADGTVFISDFHQPKSQEVAGITASQIIAADLNGDGRDELSFINAATQQFQTFDFDTQTLTTHPGAPSGPGYQTLSAANTDGIAGDEVMVAATNGQLAVFDPKTNTFPRINGSIQATGRITSGDIISGNAGEDFLVRNTVSAANGTPFVFNFDTNTFTSLGGGVDELVAGNQFTNDATDELFVNNSGLTLFVNRDAVPGQYNSGGAGFAIASGRLDDDLTAGQELFYVIGAVTNNAGGNRVFTMRPDEVPGTSLAYTLLQMDASSLNGDVAGNFGWADLLSADVDGDGLEELILRKLGNAGDPDQLFIFQNGFQSIVEAQIAVPEPATAALGLLGLAGLVARRRRNA